MRSIVTAMTFAKGMLAVAGVIAAVAAARADSAKAPAAQDAAPAASAQKASAPASGHAGPAWGYAGAAGPERWATLSSEFELCGKGTMQSPIDMSHFNGATIDPIAFDYRLSPLEIVHNGHTVQVNYAPGSSITAGGQRYELLQGHFHTPSEHSIDGRQSAMELHLVHKSADGELAVIGVMLQSGAENLALSEIWAVLPPQAGPARTIKQTLVNPRDLLPQEAGYYRYMGSLTTPPCSEGVNWFVLRQPVSVSAEQIKRFAAAVGANARPVQPVNQRFVLAPLAGQ